MSIQLKSGCRVAFGTAFAAPNVAVANKKLVMLESPFANQDTNTMRDNVTYAQKAMIDSLFFHQEAPLATHLLYTQINDEQNAEHRSMGISTGLAWRTASQSSVVYTDRGVSTGMNYGIQAAEEIGKPIEYRSLKTCGHGDQVEQLYNQLQHRTRGLKVDIYT